MSGTRAASAASSRRAKQRLVQLLFGPAHAKKGRDAHRRLVDHDSYSYSELKRAFLERVHDIHPDKHAHKKKDTSIIVRDETVERDGEVVHESLRGGHDSFVALQDAWTDYERMAKMMKRVHKGDSDANFTMFGVGCSFADSVEDSRLRGEIMDQAGRGWLSAGLIPERVTEGEVGACSTSAQGLGLCDDDMFVADDSGSDEMEKEMASPDGTAGRKRPKSLVDNVFPGRKMPPR